MTSNDRQSRWPTPEEFVSEWDERTPEARLALAERIINDAQIASKCFVMDHEGNIGRLERVLGAPAGNPLHGTPDQDAERTIPSGDERRTRYAEAIREAMSLYGEYDVDDQVDRVMAVADDEQVELRCELALANVEAEAAEAVIARVEALAERWETVPALRRGTAATELRAALDGDA